MISPSEPLAAEGEFFSSLIDANIEGLERVLTDDFVLVDVMMGSVIPKHALLDVVGSRRLRFEKVTLMESNVRFYGSTAVIVGSTEMSGRFEDTPFTARSRYTHVFVLEGNQWRLASAQGTQIAGE